MRWPWPSERCRSVREYGPQRIQPTLPVPVRRGSKQVYRDSSIMVVALAQVARWLGYEEVSTISELILRQPWRLGFPLAE